MPGDSTVVRLSPVPLLVSLDVVSSCGMVVMMGRFDCNGEEDVWSSSSCSTEFLRRKVDRKHVQKNPKPTKPSLARSSSNSNRCRR